MQGEGKKKKFFIWECQKIFSFLYHRTDLKLYEGEKKKDESRKRVTSVFPVIGRFSVLNFISMTLFRMFTSAGDNLIRHTNE